MGRRRRLVFFSFFIHLRDEAIRTVRGCVMLLDMSGWFQVAVAPAHAFSVRYCGDPGNFRFWAARVAGWRPRRQDGCWMKLDGVRASLIAWDSRTDVTVFLADNFLSPTPSLRHRNSAAASVGRAGSSGVVDMEQAALFCRCADCSARGRGAESLAQAWDGASHGWRGARMGHRWCDSD